jgi:hypothetical protein
MLVSISKIYQVGKKSKIKWYFVVSSICRRGEGKSEVGCHIGSVQSHLLVKYEESDYTDPCVISLLCHTSTKNVKTL